MTHVRNERARSIARLLHLYRLKEAAARDDRPAMHHSISHLIRLETETLTQLGRQPAANSSALETIPLHL